MVTVVFDETVRQLPVHLKVNSRSSLSSIVTLEIESPLGAPENRYRPRFGDRYPNLLLCNSSLAPCNWSAKILFPLYGLRKPRLTASASDSMHTDIVTASSEQATCLASASRPGGLSNRQVFLNTPPPSLFCVPMQQIYFDCKAKQLVPPASISISSVPA